MIRVLATAARLFGGKGKSADRASFPVPLRTIVGAALGFCLLYGGVFLAVIEHHAFGWLLVPTGLFIAASLTILRQARPKASVPPAHVPPAHCRKIVRDRHST